MRIAQAGIEQRPFRAILIRERGMEKDQPRYRYRDRPEAEGQIVYH